LAGQYDPGITRSRDMPRDQSKVPCGREEESKNGFRLFE
jgi:hypothetical protein